MSVYALAKFLHIAGVLLLFGATAIELAGLYGLYTAGTTGAARSVLRSMAVLGRLFPIASLAILASGLIMVVTVWGWTTPWILIGLAVLVGASAVAPRITGPRFGVIAGAAAVGSPDDPVSSALRAAIIDPILRATVLTLLATDLGVVYLMTAKPALVEALTVMAIAIGLGLLASWRWPVRPARPVSPALPQGVGD